MQIIFNTITFPSGTTTAQNSIVQGNSFWSVKPTNGLTNVGASGVPYFTIDVPKSNGFWYYNILCSGVGKLDSTPITSGERLDITCPGYPNGTCLRISSYIGSSRVIEYRETIGTVRNSGVFDVGSGSWTFTGTNGSGWWSTNIICSGDLLSARFKIGTATEFAYSFTVLGGSVSGLPYIPQTYRDIFGLKVNKSLSTSNFEVRQITYAKTTYSTGPFSTAIAPANPINGLAGVFYGGGGGSGTFSPGATYDPGLDNDDIIPDPPVDGVVTVGGSPMTMRDFIANTSLQPPTEPVDPEVPDES